MVMRKGENVPRSELIDNEASVGKERVDKFLNLPPERQKGGMFDARHQIKPELKISRDDLPLRIESAIRQIEEKINALHVSPVSVERTQASFKDLVKVFESNVEYEKKREALHKMFNLIGDLAFEDQRAYASASRLIDMVEDLADLYISDER